MSSETRKLFLDNWEITAKEYLRTSQILGSDCVIAQSEVPEPQQPFARRVFVRSTFALIEAMVHLQKQGASHAGHFLATLSHEELTMLEEKAYEVDRHGNVVPSRFPFLNFRTNFKMAFLLHAKACQSGFQIDYGRGGWAALENSVQVRDRLMHPKGTDQLTVTDAELDACVFALEWFSSNSSMCVLAGHASVSRLLGEQPSEEFLKGMQEIEESHRICNTPPSKIRR